jgi:hypothetical protein
MNTKLNRYPFNYKPIKLPLINAVNFINPKYEKVTLYL